MAMRALAFTLLLAATSAAIAGPIYRWVDENGVIHFSDQPQPGATIVNIQPSPPPSAGAVTRTTPRPVTVAQSSAPQDDADDFAYTSCAITSPTSEQTLPNAFSATITWRITPALRAGDRVTLALNGQLVPGVPASASSFTISPIDRGQHSVMVSVLDGEGNGLCQSPGVTFFVRQPGLRGN